MKPIQLILIASLTLPFTASAEETSFWQSVKDFFNRSTETLQEDSSDAADKVKDESKKAWDSVKEKSEPVIEDGKEAGSDLFDKSVDLFNDVKKAVMETIEED